MVRLSLGLLVLGGVLAGCGRSEPAGASHGSAEIRTAEDHAHLLATIDGESITMEDFRERAGVDLDRMDIGYRRARSQLIGNTLDQILRERVLLAEARRRGMSVEDLVAADAGSSLEPTEADVSAWYEANRARLGGRTLEPLRREIRSHLRQQRLEEASETLRQTLEAERSVAVFFEPYRVPLDNEGAPARGASDAAVTMTEFADFQCPYCGRFFPTVKQLERDFGDDLRIVYRQFPISIHPYAQKAAEASLCAQDQGKFWEMHDLMFQEQQTLSVTDLKEKAARLGMHHEEFDDCLDSGKYVERVQEDVEEGTRVGVGGTPAIFLNGVPLPGGAVSYEVAARAIRESIKRDGH
jgi:predicted DsbA family dithiol-disulfide isomerase